MNSQTWVVDASFSGTLLLPDENSDSAIELIGLARNGAVELVTSDLWWHEMANLLVSAVRRKRITAAQLPGAWALLDALPIRTNRNDRATRWPRITALAVETSLTAYDASYLALAESLKAGLATEDRGLQKAAVQRHVPLWASGRS